MTAAGNREPLLDPFGGEERRTDGTYGSRESTHTIKQINEGESVIVVTENPRGGHVPLFWISLTALFESAAFYSMYVKLVVYCEDELKLSSTRSVMINNLFTGFGYFLPVLGGMFADCIEGRYKVIMTGRVVYFTGTLVLFLSTLEQIIPYEWRIPFLVVSLVLICFGNGCAKPNVLVFAVHQITNDCAVKSVRSAIHSYYFARNIGAIIGFWAAAYVQQNISFIYGFLFPLISSLLSALCFYVGSKYGPRYINLENEGKELFHLVVQYFKALKTRGHDLERTSSFTNLLPSQVPHREAKEGQKLFWQEVNLIFIVSTLIVFWTVWNQQGTTYQLQGQQMNQVGDFLPVGSLAMCDIIVLLIFIPIFEFSRVYDRQNKYFSVLGRIFYGMVAALFTVLAAGVVETIRSKATHKISILYQIPLYTLTGLAEAFTALAAYELIFVASPRLSQGLSCGVLDASQGIGGLFGQLLIVIVGNNWYPHDFSKGHVNYYLFLLSGLMGLSILMYIALARIIFWRRGNYDGSFERHDVRNHETVE